MFPSHAHEQGVIAFQLMAALEQYELDLGRLRRSCSDLEIHGELAGQFDRMQLYASSLPQVLVHWVQLLISRYELTNRLRVAASRNQLRHSVAQTFEQHQRDAAALRHKCAGLVPRH